MLLFHTRKLTVPKLIPSLAESDTRCQMSQRVSRQINVSVVHKLLNTVHWNSLTAHQSSAKTGKCLPPATLLIVFLSLNKEPDFWTWILRTRFDSSGPEAGSSLLYFTESTSSSSCYSKWRAGKMQMETNTHLRESKEKLLDAYHWKLVWITQGYGKETDPQHWSPKLNPVDPAHHLNSISVGNESHTCLYFFPFNLITIFLAFSNTPNPGTLSPFPYWWSFVSKKWPVRIFFPDICLPFNSHAWFLWRKAWRKFFYSQ